MNGLSDTLHAHKVEVTFKAATEKRKILSGHLTRKSGTGPQKTNCSFECKMGICSGSLHWRS